MNPPLTLRPSVTTFRATQGLGLETAKSLLCARSPHTARPYHILLGARDPARGESVAASLRALPDAVGSVSPLRLDVTSAGSVAAAAELVRSELGRLDVLVNNAGVICQTEGRGGGGDGDGDRDVGGVVVHRLRVDMETNVFGAARVTEAFLPLLLAASSNANTDTDTDTDTDKTEHKKKKHHHPRLIFVGSSMGSLAGASDPGSRYYRSVMGRSPLEYRVSKAALNMLMVEYWKRVGVHEPGGRVRVYAADPGACATGFLGGEEIRKMALEKGIQGPEVGAKQIVACVLGERDGGEGRMWGAYGESPW